MVKCDEVCGPMGHVGNKESKNLPRWNRGFCLHLIEDTMNPSMVKDPANKVSCFFCSCCSFLIYSKVFSKNELELDILLNNAM
jgi:hypothetical protein